MLSALIHHALSKEALPDVMAEGHALLDDPVALCLGGAALGDVVLLLRPLRPVRRRRPPDC